LAAFLILGKNFTLLSCEMMMHLDVIHPARGGAGSRSMFDSCDLRLSGDQNIIHGHTKQVAERKKMIGSGDGLALLPEVDGLGRVETEELLDIGDRKVVLRSQTLNVSSGGNRIDTGKRNMLFHTLPPSRHWVVDLLSCILKELHPGLGNQAGSARREKLSHCCVYRRRIPEKKNLFLSTGNRGVEQVAAEHPLHIPGDG